MSNMIKLGAFNIQEALYNNTNIISQKFCKNNVCVFGFKSKKLLIVNGVKYKNAMGVSVDANKNEMEVNYGKTTIKVPTSDINVVTIIKEGPDIIVTIK